jgi:hypothetical protein
MTDDTPAGAGTRRYGNLRALFINCTLKRSPELSHTQGLISRSQAIMTELDRPRRPRPVIPRRRLRRPRH